jgi:quinol monooxygenase YgiN
VISSPTAAASRGTITAMTDDLDAALAPLVMVVEFCAAPGRRDDLRTALLALVEPTRAEDGCLLYDLHEGREDPDVFAFYEIWRDREAHAAHDLTDHVAGIRAALPELIVGSTRKLLLRRIEP